MDHLRISGNEPSSVILSQIKWFQKKKTLTRKCQNKLKPKRDGVINPQNYNFNQFYTENFDAFKRYESIEVDRRTWLHVPSGTH